jgi:hypothetical protein
VLTEWAAAGRPQPDASFEYKPTGVPIEYRQLHLNQPWQRSDIGHELTANGIRKFVEDYRSI